MWTSMPRPARISATASRRLAEDLEWTALGSDEREADAREAALGKLGRRAERELVECNRPDDAARNGDDEAACACGLSLLEEPAEAFGVDVTPKRERPFKRGGRARAARDEDGCRT